MSERYDKQESEIKVLKELEFKTTLLRQDMRIDELEQYSKRSNVLFDGIREVKGENTENFVIEKCSEAGIKIDKADLVNTHRLGSARSFGDKPRPIIARFIRTKLLRVFCLHPPPLPGWCPCE